MPAHDPSGRETAAPRQRPPIPTGTKVLLGVLLGIPIVLPLMVPLYARESPDLGGVPFFFWFQFALIPMAAVLVWIAFLVVSRHENKGRSR